MERLQNMTLFPDFQVISAVQRQSQTRVQWSILLDEALHLEDVAKSQNCSRRHFTHSFPSELRLSWIQRLVCTPTVGEFQSLIVTKTLNQTMTEWVLLRLENVLVP